MSISISNSLSTASLADATASSDAAAAQRTQQSTAESTDTVKLSQSQQAVQLYQQGEQVSYIASSLGLPVETVNTYLGISNSPST
jgi:DNA-binding NarL/FixJ family response regulator